MYQEFTRFLLDFYPDRAILIAEDKPMDMRYRVYTEDVNREAILEIVGKYFQGFNVSEAVGYYKGGQERALVIEVLAPLSRANVVRFISKVIAQTNKQECLLVTTEPINAEFVS
jgi:hypothetical protein